MNCKKCGHEIDKKAVICVNCGCKVKKPVIKKWWFWVLVIFVVIIIGSATSGGSEETAGGAGNAGLNVTQQDITNATQQNVTYEAVELQTMFDDLDANAMKAEKNYQGKLVEFKCKISNFDSDGSYISVEPINASEWNFTTAMCYIKNDTQKDYLLNKNVGDEITIKGKIKSIGEILGYSIDIKEVY